jgi:hypothetical protein
MAGLGVVETTQVSWRVAETARAAAMDEHWQMMAPA